MYNVCIYTSVNIYINIFGSYIYIYQTLHVHHVLYSNECNNQLYISLYIYIICYIGERVPYYINISASTAGGRGEEKQVVYLLNVIGIPSIYTYVQL